MFEVISNAKIKSSKQIEAAIRKQILLTLGELGAADVGLLMIKFNYVKQRGMIKVGHKSVDQVKACLSLIQKVGRQKVIFRSVGVSGIIKKAESKYLR